VGGHLYPFPINLTTLEMFFGRSFTSRSAEAFIAQQRLPIPSPRNSEEFVLSRLGRPLYEAFYQNYTKKQWGRSAAQLDPSVCGRIPIRLNRDERYVDGKHQVMPAEGYTALFSKMVQHPLIECRLKLDYDALRKASGPRVATLYTGPLDTYFHYRFGHLPWRSLHFSARTYDVPYRQPCVQINYPNQHAYTRSVEIKHVTGQKHRKTVVIREYPRAQGEPYYPIPSADSKKLYSRYWALAERETKKKNVYFAGRLAEYRYINTDQAVASGLAIWDRILAERGGC
jgi:UDP-galactopyranose mutase